jgi:hypothetical protein
MSNSDTIFALQGLGVATPPRNQLATITGIAATTETLLLMGSDSGSNVTAFMPFPGQSDIYGSSNPVDPNANASILLDNIGGKMGSSRGASRPYFQNLSFDGRAFRVRIQGRVLFGAAANTLTINIYQNTKANGPVLGGNKIASVAIGAAAITAVSGNFIVEATGEWDSVSAKMQGSEQWGSAAGFYATRAVGQSVPFAVAAPLSNSLMYASVTFATGPGNSITPFEFAFEDC